MSGSLSIPNDRDVQATDIVPAILIVLWMLITLSLWIFAFWHVPEATPKWLLQAQAACFGISENGLPDTSGWLILVLAPLSFLAAAVVVYGRAIVCGLKKLTSHYTGRVLFAALSLCVVLQSAWVLWRVNVGLQVAEASYISESTESLPDHYPQLNQPASPFSLVDQHGDSLSLESLRGRPVLLTFAFAHCQTVCPAVVQQVLAAARKFPPHSLSVVIVTLDPWRDTPNALPTLAKRWGLGVDEHVLSGTVSDVLAVHKNYQMEIQRDERTGDVIHPSPSYIINSEGNISYVFNNAPTSWLIAGLDRSDFS